MRVLLYIGIALIFPFFIAWFFRNVFKYMYKKQSILFNRILWWGFLPLSVLGVILIIVGAAAGV